MLTTPTLAQQAGVTYRRLDYLTRTGILPPSEGTGRPREWTPDQVKRLHVAAALDRAHPARNPSVWPTAARAALEGPTPPDHGWALLRPGATIAYAAALCDLDGPGLVAQFDARG